MSVTVRVDQGIAFVALAHPPVNALGHGVRTGLVDAFNKIRGDGSIAGVVLHGEGRGFCAGGDIREFNTPLAAADPGLSKHVHPAIEQCGKTVVAAIHGFALGGGLETAMACHFRIATPDARLGLPEARLGVIPLSATQRLPRLVGLETAIDMIATGREVRGEQAPHALLDAVIEAADLLDTAASLARSAPPPLVRDAPFPAEGAEATFAAAYGHVVAGRYTPFAHHLIRAIEAGLHATFDESIERVRAIHDATINTLESKAARAAFLAKAKEI